MKLHMLIMYLALGLSQVSMHGRNINFTIQNNLKQRVHYAPLGTRNNSPQQSELGIGSRTLQGKTARFACMTNGGVGHEIADSDQYPRLLFTIEDDPTVYLYEFNAQPYDEISISLEKGPRLVPKTIPMGNNIQASEIKHIEYQEPHYEESQYQEPQQHEPQLEEPQQQEPQYQKPTESELYKKAKKSSWWPF